jgi:hypothetical protein
MGCGLAESLTRRLPGRSERKHENLIRECRCPYHIYFEFKPKHVLLIPTCSVITQNVQEISGGGGRLVDFTYFISYHFNYLKITLIAISQNSRSTGRGLNYIWNES